MTDTQVSTSIHVRSADFEAHSVDDGGYGAISLGAGLTATLTFKDAAHARALAHLLIELAKAMESAGPRYVVEPADDDTDTPWCVMDLRTDRGFKWLRTREAADMLAAELNAQRMAVSA